MRPGYAGRRDDSHPDAEDLAGPFVADPRAERSAGAPHDVLGGQRDGQRHAIRFALQRPLPAFDEGIDPGRKRNFETVRQAHAALRCRLISNRHTAVATQQTAKDPLIPTDMKSPLSVIQRPETRSRLSV